MTYLILTSVTFCFVVQGTLGFGTPNCPTLTSLPEGEVYSPNLHGSRPLYLLDVRKTREGYKPNQLYTLRVQTTDRKRKFNDVRLSVESADPLQPHCESGILLVDDSLHSPAGCPNIVSTEEKQPMGRSILKWRAPACGCVKIRAQVHAEGRYFQEKEDTGNGPLLKMICPSTKHTEGSYTDDKINNRKPNFLELSREQKINHLCDVTETLSASQAADVSRFLTIRGMKEVPLGQKMVLSIALEQRKLDTDYCCNKGTAKLECFGNIRRRRIDNYCGTGQPDIPFTAAQEEWMKTKEEDCCWKIGEARYTCFNYTLSVEAMLRDGRRSKVERSPVSLDGLDPANDIEDYTTPPGQAPVSMLEDDIRDHRSKQKDSSDRVTDRSVKDSDEFEDTESVDYEEDSEEGDIDDDESTDVEQGPPISSVAQQQSMASESCCLAGITAGTMVTSQGVMGCYNMADQYERLYSEWNKQCDRRFFVCCMQVIYGMSGTRSDPAMLLAPTMGVPDLHKAGSHGNGGGEMTSTSSTASSTPTRSPGNGNRRSRGRR